LLDDFKLYIYNLIVIYNEEMFHMNDLTEHPDLKHVLYILYQPWHALASKKGGGVITCACVAGKIRSPVNIVNSRISASLYQWQQVERQIVSF
jgi:hypothetical protein